MTEWQLYGHLASISREILMEEGFDGMKFLDVTGLVVENFDRIFFVATNGLTTGLQNKFLWANSRPF
jgi:hypothetical protein